MGAAITLLVILTISVAVVRVAAVALRLTGMPADVARFQARSAFTGTGFTTSESEAIVNHPIRRRLIGLLMLQGNVGLVTVLATFIVSLVATDNSMGAVSRQLFWLLGAIVLFWTVVLNPYADRAMCAVIGWLLQRLTSITQPGPSILLQLPGNYSVAEHGVPSNGCCDEMTLANLCAGESEFRVLGIEHENGSYSSAPDKGARLTAGDRLVVYCSDEAQIDLRMLNSFQRKN